MHQQKYYDYWNHRRATVKDEKYNIWGIITDGRLHKPRLAEIYFTGCRHTHTYTNYLWGSSRYCAKQDEPRKSLAKYINNGENWSDGVRWRPVWQACISSGTPATQLPHPPLLPAPQRSRH